MLIPKLPLTPSLATSLAAMKNRPLFCIVQKATEQYIASLSKMAAQLPESKVAIAELLAVARDWHIEPVTGEFLTKSAAVKNCLIRQSSGDYIAQVHTYSAVEVREVYK